MVNRTGLLSWGLVSLLALTSARPATAQALDGTLQGRVTEASGGAPIPAATVTVVGMKGETRTAQTDGSGNYLLPALPAGDYVLRVSAAGYKAYSERVTVLVQRATNLNAALEV